MQKIISNIEGSLVNPKGLYIVENKRFDKDITIIVDKDEKFSIHIENCVIENIYINIKVDLNDSVIDIQNNTIKGKIGVSCVESSGIAITLNNNNCEINSDYSKLIFKDSEQSNETESVNYKKYTGYKEKYGSKINLKDYYPSVRKCLLDFKNIPQYVGTEDDPPLNVGCEATACAATLSYVLKKDISKNFFAKYMPKSEPGTISFWESFIGDIYKDGWGCMSNVSLVSLNSFLKDNSIENIKAINLTNSSLYKLLYLVSKGHPIIVWSTMGNDDRMYKVKYGSTKWNIEGEELYWPGNDHSLTIVGFDLDKDEIYLADPEVNNSSLRTRNIYEFENRFTELYSQSILVCDINEKI